MNIKFLKFKKKFRKGGLHISADTYWEMLLGLALVLVISSVVFGFYLFKTINSELILSSQSAQSPTNNVNKDRIDKVLEYFAEKDQKATSIIGSPSPVVDPSR